MDAAGLETIMSIDTVDGTWPTEEEQDLGYVESEIRRARLKVGRFYSYRNHNNVRSVFRYDGIGHDPSYIKEFDLRYFGYSMNGTFVLDGRMSVAVIKYARERGCLRAAKKSEMKHIAKGLLKYTEPIGES